MAIDTTQLVDANALNEYHQGFIESYMKTSEISDLDIVTPGQPSGLVYDFRGTEMVVGKVIEADGTEKVLYKKTIACGALPNKTNKSVAHRINNLKQVIRIGGVCVYNGADFANIPYASPDGNCLGVNINSTNIELNASNANYSNYVGYITLLYTKTT